MAFNRTWCRGLRTAHVEAVCMGQADNVRHRGGEDLPQAGVQGRPVAYRHRGRRAVPLLLPDGAPAAHPGSSLHVCTPRTCGAFRLCSVVDRVRLRTRALVHLLCHGKSVGALKGGRRRHSSGQRGSMRSQHPNQCSSHPHCSARIRRNCATYFGWSPQSWSTRSRSGSCTHCTAASAAHRPSLQRTSTR